MPGTETFPSLDSALNDRYRGHVDRDFTEWAGNHAYEQAADIPADASRAWIGRRKTNYRGIGQRQALRHLICGAVDQPFLEEIGTIADLERLELEGPLTAQSLEPLTALRRLAFLSIDSPRTIDDFSILLRLPALRTLIITNPGKTTDLAWLADAHHLEVIGIEGGMWSNCTIASLAPLAGLRALRALLAVSTRLADKDLSPLAACPRLDYLRIARVAPREEFERLRSARPDMVCAWFQPESWPARGPRR